MCQALKNKHKNVIDHSAMNWIIYTYEQCLVWLQLDDLYFAKVVSTTKVSERITALLDDLFL